jgi:hypothetical protein
MSFGNAIIALQACLQKKGYTVHLLADPTAPWPHIALSLSPRSCALLIEFAGLEDIDESIATLRLNLILIGRQSLEITRGAGVPLLWSECAQLLTLLRMISLGGKSLDPRGPKLHSLTPRLPTTENESQLQAIELQLSWMIAL